MATSGVPQIDYSFIGKLPDVYEAGKERTREYQLRDEMQSAIDPATGQMDFRKAAGILLKYKPEEGLKTMAAYEQADAMNRIRAYASLTPGEKARLAADGGEAGAGAGVSPPSPVAPPAAAQPVNLAPPETVAPVPPGPAPAGAEVALPTPGTNELAVGNQPMPEGGWIDLGGGIRGRPSPNQPQAAPPVAAPPGVPPPVQAPLPPAGVATPAEEGPPTIPGFSPVAAPDTGPWANMPAATTKEMAPAGTAEQMVERAKNVEKLRTTLPNDRRAVSDIDASFKRIEDNAKFFLDKQGNANDYLKVLTDTYRIGKFDTTIPRSFAPLNWTKTARVADAKFNNMGVKIGLAKLDEMRQASKNGSSGMGQLALQESVWLQEFIAAWKQAATPEAAAEAAREVIKWAGAVRRATRQEFIDTYTGLR